MRIVPLRTLEEVHVAQRLTYTVAEVAEILGISRSTAYDCVRRGEIPALTLGRRVVVSRAALSGLLEGAGGNKGTDDARQHHAAHNDR
jgi:excisionase family DNA binding protein